MIDLLALSTAVYARLYSDSAGAALRAVLGAGAASVLMAEDVRREALTIERLPLRPLLALRRGAVPVIGRVINTPIYTWYCYDDISRGYGGLEALPMLIAQAYEGGLSVSTVAVDDITVEAGAQTRSESPALLLQVVTVAIGAV